MIDFEGIRTATNELIARLDAAYDAGTYLEQRHVERSLEHLRGERERHLGELGKQLLDSAQLAELAELYDRVENALKRHLGVN